MLLHTDTLEVSNVKRAANRKKFAVSKSEISMSTVNAVISTPVEGEEQYVATLKSAGADAARIEAATAMFRLRQGYADVLKPEDLGVSTKSKKAHEEPDGDEEMEMEEEEKAKKSKKSVVAPVSKSADLSPEMHARVEAVFKSNELLAQQVKELTAKNELAEYTAKAEREFSHVPGSRVELAATLKAAHDAGPDAEKRILSALSATNDIVRKSAMFQDIGTMGGGGAADAHSKIQALAAGLTMKAENGNEMTPAQKYNYVITKTAEGRTLYNQYIEERKQAVKNA
jgi:hypothetical protein